MSTAPPMSTVNVEPRAGRRFEVIKAGIERYNSTFALGRIRDELLRYRPHMIIGGNDVMKTDLAIRPAPRAPAWPGSGGGELFLQRDGRWSEQGHRLAVEIVVQKMVARG